MATDMQVDGIVGLDVIKRFDMIIEDNISNRTDSFKI